MEMTNLKPCPFCGGEANFFLTASGKAEDLLGCLFGICCKKCGIMLAKKNYKVEVEFSEYGAVKTVTDERAAAIETWNLRTHH